MSSSPWFWRFNPRFYRGTRPNTFSKYLYWIFGYEVLAMALIGLYVWWTVVPMAKLSVERRDREIDRGRRERLGLSRNSESPPDTLQKGATGLSAGGSSQTASEPTATDTSREIK